MMRTKSLKHWISIFILVGFLLGLAAKPIYADDSADATPTPTPVLYLPLFYRPACLIDLYEPNDTILQAHEVTLGTTTPMTAWFCANDPDDYFKFEINQVLSLRIALTDVQAESDIDLYLYNNDLEMVGFSNQGRVGASEEISQTLNTGSYYLRVYPFSIPDSVMKSTYKLAIGSN